MADHMTPDRFADMVNGLAREYGYALRDLSFDSTGQKSAGHHSYRGLQVNAMGEKPSVILVPGD